MGHCFCYYVTGTNKIGNGCGWPGRTAYWNRSLAGQSTLLLHTKTQSNEIPGASA